MRTRFSIERSTAARLRSRTSAPFFPYVLAIASRMRASASSFGRTPEIAKKHACITVLTRPGSPASRATAQKVERSERYGVWKIQPLADWSEQDVWAYIMANDIPYNPLHDAGYRSIGCIPCTRPTRADEEERAGRWAGSDKLECGIHLEERTA